MPDVIRLSRDPSTGQFFTTDDSGQRVTLAMHPSDVHDPTELDTYLAGYSAFNFRADDVSRIVPCDNDEDYYRAFSSDDAFEPVKVKGSASATIPEVDPRSSLTKFKVQERFIGSFIPAQTQAQATNPNLDPRMAAGRRCLRALNLDREIDVFGMLGASANWNAAVITAAGNLWTDQTNGDPILNLQTAIEKSYQPVNGVWLTQKGAHAFLRHTKVREHMRQMLGDSAVNQAVAGVANAQAVNVDFVIPGLPPVHVVASKYKSGSALVSTMLDTVCVLTTSVPAGVPTSGEEIATTHTFRRNGPSGVGVNTREFFVDARGPLGGTMLVTSVADIPIMTSNLAGGIITGILS